jgi:RHS repeat-associated protein
LSAFDMIGGMLGFVSRNGVASVDDLTIRSWNAGTSQFDVVEHVDTFDVDGNGRSSVDPAHDAAGNMTFDGTQKLTYDGWNRLATVAHAYRDGGGSLQSGQANVTMSYDGRGRRVKKALANAGQWDCTYHYYYDGDSLIETRNGSDVRIKQHVWGTRYVDELCQLTAYPATGDEDPIHYWACQDSNYNVLGVVDSDAVLVERYEYEPYGERTAFFSPGTNDVGCYAPTQTSRRVTLAGSGSMGVCEVGHQGLIHDEEVGLVYNRARQLHPTLGRFMRRDPMGYAGGVHLLEYLQGHVQAKVDPTGTFPIDPILISGLTSVLVDQYGPVIANPPGPVTFQDCGDPATQSGATQGELREWRRSACNKMRDSFRTLAALGGAGGSLTELEAIIGRPLAPAERNALNQLLGEDGSNLIGAMQILGKAYERGCGPQTIECEKCCPEGRDAYTRGCTWGSLASLHICFKASPDVDLAILHEMTHYGCSSDDPNDPIGAYNLEHLLPILAPIMPR